MSQRNKLWDTLNSRQQIYVTSMLDLDQAKEQGHDDYFHTNHGYDPRPASEWRK